ncbi:DUF4468 domain-containing protein [Croceimicrobium sp.]|uniref:DUF4468 domain-containing protein n=1 Tax=Croceimicrobium sp. TaxID=2828340 RepID=UPI003BAC73D4
MKNVIALLFSFVAFSAMAQSNPTEIPPTVVEVDSVFTKEDVYKSLKVYIAESFKNANAAIQMDDLDLGVIIVKGTYENYMKGIFGERNPAGFWHFTAKFEVKDGRYRYSVYDIYLEQAQATTYPDKIYRWDDYRANRLREMIAELQATFGSIPVEATESEDW